MFAATGYDAAMVLVAALAKAENPARRPPATIQEAILDGIKSEGPSVQGITSEAGYTFDEYNNPIKSAVIMTVTGGAEVFQETF
jgi:branched-chain amino acid transport system substrate-binding protein